MPKLILALVAAAGVLPLSAQTGRLPERFTAFAVSLSNVGSGAGTVEITVTRWSTEAERETLTTTLRQQGPGALLSALQDMRSVGTIRTPDSLGYDLRYAHQEPGEDGGRRIVIATDRPISFWEAVNRPRTFDYPFILIEMRIGADGTGEGKMSLATKITATDKVITLENYASQPVMLKNVRSRE